MKQLIIIAVIVLSFVLINAGYIYYLFNPHLINAWEIRFYIGWGIVLMVLLSFAVLRIYNAIVVNSRYLRNAKTDSIKMQAAIKGFAHNVDQNTTEVKKLRTNNQLNKTAMVNSMDKLRNAFDNLKRSK